MNPSAPINGVRTRLAVTLVALLTVIPALPMRCGWQRH